MAEVFQVWTIGVLLTMTISITIFFVFDTDRGSLARALSVVALAILWPNPYTLTAAVMSAAWSVVMIVAHASTLDVPQRVHELDELD